MTALVVLGLVLWCVLPGLGAGVLLTSYAAVPDRPGLLLARVLACGVSVWFLGAALLTRTTGLTSASSWVLSIALGVAGLGVLLLPRCRAVLRGALPEAGYTAAVTLVSLVAWLPVGLAVLRTSWSPLGSTPWYYWSLASQVADLGHLPTEVTEWGTTLPFLADYQLFSTGTAALLLQADGADVQVLHGVLVVAVLLLGAGTSLVALAFGAGRTASMVAAPVAVATGLGVLRLTGYRPEAFGLGLIMVVVALFVDALRHRERTSLVAGCLVGAVLSQVHGIALATAGMLLVAVVVALLPGQLVAADTLWSRAWPFLRRSAVAGIALGVSVVVLGLLLGGVSGSEHAGNLEDRGGAEDLTWDFFRATKGLPPSEPATNGQILGASLQGLYDRASLWVLVGVVAAVVVLAVAARRRVEAREILVFTGGSLVALSVVAAVFALGWQGYVPRRTGAQRLVKEMTLLAGPLLACAVGLLPARGRAGGRARSNAVRVVPVALVCLGALWSGSVTADAVSRQRPDRDDLQALQDLGIPSGSVILTNAYVEGYLDQVTDGTGLLEGRAPYTYPDVLERADGLLRDAQSFYAAPGRHQDFLTEHDVDYVIVSKPRSYALATDNVFRSPVHLGKLKNNPALALELDRPGFRVYRVVDVP